MRRDSHPGPSRNFSIARLKKSQNKNKHRESKIEIVGSTPQFQVQARFNMISPLSIQLDLATGQQWDHKNRAPIRKIPPDEEVSQKMRFKAAGDLIVGMATSHFSLERMTRTRTRRVNWAEI